MQVSESFGLFFYPKCDLSFGLGRDSQRYLGKNSYLSETFVVKYYLGIVVNPGPGPFGIKISKIHSLLLEQCQPESQSRSK